MGARFKADIKRGASGGITGGGERHGLGMGAAAGLGPAPGDDLAGLDDHRANGGIGPADRQSAPGKAGGGGEPAQIVGLAHGAGGFSAGLLAALAEAASSALALASMASTSMPEARPITL